MLYQIFSTTWKDIKILLKDWHGIATLFLMPLMFIIIMSTALQGLFYNDADKEPERIPVANLDQGDYAADAITALEDMEGIEVVTTWNNEVLTREAAEALVIEGEYPLVVVFPTDFSRQIEAREVNENATAVIELLADPAISTPYVAPIQGMVYSAAERVAETSIVESAVSSGLETIFAEVPEENRPEFTFEKTGSSIVDIQQISPPNMEAEFEPDTYQQNVPGYTVMGVFFIIGAMSTSILTEKREGTFRRLLAAPLPKPVLLAGKILPYYIVNLIQIAIMFTAGHLLFGMTFGDPLALAVISMALSAAATGLGIMIAAMGKTDTQVGGLTSLLTLTMSALGGCLMPTYIMPDFLQEISQLIPHKWAMQGFQDVLVRGYGVEGIMGEAGILLVFAAAFFLTGLRLFRFE